MERQNMTSSDDTFRLLRGWKKSEVILHAELALVGEKAFSCVWAVVRDVTEDELTLFVASHERVFILAGAILETGENVPHPFRKSLTKAVDVTLEDGGRIVLVESPRM
jgi:hypothetical protein